MTSECTLASLPPESFSYYNEISYNICMQCHTLARGKHSATAKGRLSPVPQFSISQTRDVCAGALNVIIHVHEQGISYSVPPTLPLKWLLGFLGTDVKSFLPSPEEKQGGSSKLLLQLYHHVPCSRLTGQSTCELRECMDLILLRKA